MRTKNNINIIFDKKNNIEIFNGKKYPLGYWALRIINELSSLTYSEEFILKTYKDDNLFYYYYQTLEEIAEDASKVLYDELNLLPKQIKNLNNYTTEFSIDGINVSNLEFKKLVKFMLCFDTYFKLHLKYEKLMENQYFKYYFCTIKNYKIPEYNIIDNGFVKQNENIFAIDNIDNLNNTNLAFALSAQNDEMILKELVKSQMCNYEFICKNFIDIILAFMEYAIINNLKLKKCRLCNRFFLVNHGNTEFCNNIRPQYTNESFEAYSKQKLTCSKYNQKKLSFENLSEIKKAIRTVTARIRKRIKDGKESPDYLKQWKQSVKEKSILLSDEKLIKWILEESDKNQKRKVKKYGSKRNNKK